MLSTADMADSAALSDHAGGCEARILGNTIGDEGNDMSNPETGPLFGVPLIATLPLRANGRMVQVMPSRADLCDVRQVCERVAAGYEVLLSHYRVKCFRVAELESEVMRLRAAK